MEISTPFTKNCRTVDIMDNIACIYRIVLSIDVFFLKTVANALKVLVHSLLFIFDWSLLTSLSKSILTRNNFFQPPLATTPQQTVVI